MSKLTPAQAEILKLCIETGAAWTTSRTSPTVAMLDEWTANGWFEAVEPPASFLASYRITDAGRRALTEGDSRG